jgi:hypothetical protein
LKACLTSRTAAIAGAFAILAALSFTGVAQAITDTVFRYTTPKTAYFPISGMAMNASSDNYDYTNGWFNGLSPVSGVPCFSTGVNLPHGSTITGLTIWYESGAVGGVSVSFYRFQLNDGSFDKIGERTFLNDTNGLRQAGNVPVTTSFATVNNFQFSYGLGICLEATTFRDARVRYTYNTAGD